MNFLNNEKKIIKNAYYLKTFVDSYKHENMDFKRELTYMYTVIKNIIKLCKNELCLEGSTFDEIHQSFLNIHTYNKCNKIKSKFDDRHIFQKCDKALYRIENIVKIMKGNVHSWIHLKKTHPIVNRKYINVFHKELINYCDEVYKFIYEILINALNNKDTLFNKKFESNDFSISPESLIDSVKNYKIRKENISNIKNDKEPIKNIAKKVTLTTFVIGGVIALTKFFKK